MKKHGIILIIICYITLFSNILYAQGPSPDVSVDTYTGKGKVTIPLANVNSGKLQVPVRLVYDASGMKLSDDGKDATANSIGVGVNWSLKAGGKISRTIKDLPDDHYGPGPEDISRGWLHGNGGQLANNFVSSSDNDLTDCTDEEADYLFFQTANLEFQEQDLEPDIFDFSFGEYSGQFVFDYATPTGETLRPVRLMSDQDLKITYTLIDNAISEFKIITDKGVIYTFAPTATISKQTQEIGTGLPYFFSRVLEVMNSEREHQTYTVEWGLSSIATQDGTQPIQVNYSNWITKNDTIETKGVLKHISADTYYEDILYYESVVRSNRRPIEINGPGNTVTISASGVKVYKSSLIREISFTTETNNGRTFLTQLEEKNDGLSTPPLQFVYHNVSALPPVHSVQQDVWGYFNGSGESQGRLYPSIYVYPQLAGADRYRIYPIPGNTSYYLLEGADRLPNEDYVAFGSLQTIKLPAGGNIRLEYESNKYHDQAAEIDYSGGGLRVKKVTIHDGVSYANDMVKEYAYAANSGRINYVPVFAFSIPVYVYPQIYPSEKSGEELWKLFTLRLSSNLAPEGMTSTVSYGSVTEKIPGSGKTVYRYAAPAQSHELEADNSLTPYNYRATWSKIARRKINGICREHGTFENGYYTFPFPDNTNYDFVYGKLLDKKIYSESGSPIKEIQYKYQRISKDTHPKIIKGIKFNLSGALYFGQYSLLTDVREVLEEEKTISYDRTNPGKKLESTTTYTYDSPNHRLLTRISATNSDGTVKTTRISYPADYTVTASGSVAAKALYWMKENHMLAFPVEQIETVQKPAEPEKVARAVITTYRDEVVVLDNSNHRFVHADRVLELKTATLLNDFSPLSTGMVGGIEDLIPDSRYRPVLNYLNWQYGTATEISDDKGNINSIILEPSGRVIAEIGNARLAEMAFSGFNPSNANPTTGRRAEHDATVLGSSEILSRTGIQKNGLNPSYTFTCWLKAADAGTLTVTLTDGNANTAVSEIGYTATAGDWRFYKGQIPVDALGATFDATVQSNTEIVLDYDMLLYPTFASVQYYSYNDFGKTSDNDVNGKTLFYEYDKLGRVTYTRDQNKSILKKNSYEYQMRTTLNGTFTITGDNKMGGVQVFTAAETLPGTAYHWNFGDGTDTITYNPVVQYTYFNGGNYTVSLMVAHNVYAESSSSQMNKVLVETNANVCVFGPIEYHIYEHWMHYEEDENCGHPHGGPGENTFLAYILDDVIDNLPPEAVVSYKWERRFFDNPNWSTSSNTSNTWHISSLRLPEYSYFVRCTITISNCDYLTQNEFVFYKSVSFFDV